MALTDDNLRKKIAELPLSPGVYQYFDKNNKIIYIGKAKKLRNRVSSYLNKSNQAAKTKLLVTQICDLQYIVVKTEQDALLLENNLIKKYKPKYNILLKDDKGYPWIAISKDEYPKVTITRNLIRGRADYFGPYTNVRYANTLINLFQSIFKLRTCNLPLTQKSIFSGKFKVCLEYHIGNCEAPCVAKISKEKYTENIELVRNILKGNLSIVLKYLENRMEKYSKNMDFEKAHELKLSFELLKDHQSKSTILSTSLESIDVFSYIDAENYAYVNYLRIIKGAVNQVYTVQIIKKTDESESEIFSSTIFEIRNMVGSASKTIIVPFVPEFQLNNVNYIVPQKGDKKQLLELSLRNANFFKLDKDKDRSNKTKAYSTMNKLLSIKKDLKLPTLPHRIECFDNSNIQGTNPVASCVVFIDGKPAKREYRKFHIKTVVGADDFASMEEIIYRRYKRRLDENAELPDLIVVDGGKGQLHAALNSLEKLDLLAKVPIVGLAKQMEEIYYPGDSNPYILAKTSIALKVLMFARDEAHRFGITFHRSLRELKFIDTELQNIDNIGPSTIQKLMERFKSVNNVKNATLQELLSCTNLDRAQAIYLYFHED